MTGTTRATSSGTPNAARRGVPLSGWTTLGLGGPAEVMVEVGDVGALAAVLDEADGAGRPVLVLGGGSNLVVADEGFAGTVVRLGINGVSVARDGAGPSSGPGRARTGRRWSASAWPKACPASSA